MSLLRLTGVKDGATDRERPEKFHIKFRSTSSIFGVLISFWFVISYH